MQLLTAPLSIPTLSNLQTSKELKDGMVRVASVADVRLVWKGQLSAAYP